MDRAVEKMRGIAKIKVTGANTEDFLNYCADCGITLIRCRAINEAELICSVYRRHLKQAEYCAGKKGCELCVVSLSGPGFVLSRVKGRYVLLCGLLLVLMLLGYSGMLVWKIDVVGNERVTDGQILSALKECGVDIGSNWTEFDSDMIRSNMLEKIPELSYLTVNAAGSRAEVIVRERIEKPEMDYDKEPADILAGKSGVISRINVFRGHAMVKAGDEVTTGDVLISGTVPGIELWEQPVKYTQVSALGEVWAETEYEFTAAQPFAVQQKIYTGRTSRSYALLFGENRLNFYKNTGIYRTGCDTIYYVWNLELPNVFTLPLALVCESRAQYELVPAETTEDELKSGLKEALLQRLSRETGEDAQVLSTFFAVRKDENMVYVTLRASCLENIAVKQPADVYPREE